MINPWANFLNFLKYVKKPVFQVYPKFFILMGYPLLKLFLELELSGYMKIMFTRYGASLTLKFSTFTFWPLTDPMAHQKYGQVWQKKYLPNFWYLIRVEHKNPLIYVFKLLDLVKNWENGSNLSKKWKNLKSAYFSPTHCLLIPFYQPRSVRLVWNLTR